MNLPDAPNLRPPSRLRTWAPLLLITLFGAVLRFAFLDRPGIWGDEAATYGRVNGSYFQLLEVLQFDGFAPLHYELYWLLARFSRLEPWALRLWPAIAGTLTVPAMYFLARQLFDRRHALACALLAACSAYLNYYSRDAKMYAPLWLFVILSMGCFLWWLNAPRDTSPRPHARLRWWCWIFCTTAAAGIHTPGLVVLAIQPLAFVAHPRGRSFARAFMLLLGVAFIAAGPAYHYTTFNKWTQRIEETGWNASMIQWVGPYNQYRDLPQLARYTATAFAIAWEWPDKPWQRGETSANTAASTSPRGRGSRGGGFFSDAGEPVAAPVLRAFQTFAIALAAVLAAGLIPWRRLFAWSRAAYHRLARHEPPVAPTRPADATYTVGPYYAWLLLSVWVVVPAYVAYVISLDNAAAPWALPRWVVGVGPWAWAVAALSVVGVMLSFRRLGDPFKALGIVAIVFAACSAAHAGVNFHRTHDVAIQFPQRKAESATQPATSPASLASRLPSVSVREHPPTPARMVWMPRYLGALWPALAMVAVALLLRLPPVIAQLALAGVLLANLANHAAKVTIDPEPPVGRQLAELWADAHADPLTADSLQFVAWTNPLGVEPGTGTLSSGSGRYHLSTKLDTPFDPPTFRSGWSFNPRSFFNINTDLRQRPVRDAIAKRPRLSTVVLWQRSERSTEPPRELLLPLLGRGWQLRDTTDFQAYDHWTWRPLSLTRRSVYERTESPDTRPAVTRPATLTATPRPVATRPAGTRTASPATRPRPTTTP